MSLGYLGFLILSHFSESVSLQTQVIKYRLLQVFTCKAWFNKMYIIYLYWPTPRRATGSPKGGGVSTSTKNMNQNWKYHRVRGGGIQTKCPCMELCGYFVEQHPLSATDICSFYYHTISRNINKVSLIPYK